MRWSRMFIPTLREDPSRVEAASHRLFLRAGYIRQLAPGIFSFLPLAQRVRRKIEDIVRDEMNRSGAQEFLLPALHPAKLWRESGRFEALQPIMFQLKDHKETELVLGPTHEEVFTALARSAMNSYRQLPQVWYQIQTRFRDEPAPRAGLVRMREFTMKDAYSFDLDPAGLDLAFRELESLYGRIFTRCGLKFLAVERNGVSLNGGQSIQFMVRAESGEDRLATCKGCGFVGNAETTLGRVAPEQDTEGPAAPQEFPTPDVRTIADLTRFTGGTPASRQIKTLVMSVDGSLKLVLLRGDHVLNEAKLADAAGTFNIRPASPEEIREALGALPGSLGAVGVSRETHPKITCVLVDLALRGRHNLLTGANQDDFHLSGVSVERDIKADAYADLRSIEPGDGCPCCPGQLEIRNAIEVGHIFKLGTTCSQSMGATVAAEDGTPVPLVMGSYALGVDRVMAAVAELHHDEQGLCWPSSIAPFRVLVTAVNVKEEGVLAAAEKIYRHLCEHGVDVLFDDRDERAGVKFNDADLIGVPCRITVGKKAVEGKVEVFTRASGKSEVVPLSSIVEHIVRQVKNLSQKTLK